MANRFTKKRSVDLQIVKSLILPVFLFVIVAVLASRGMGQLNQKTEMEQLRSAKNAVMRATIQCYVSEGQYPPDVKYLVDHYGLQVDQEQYLIHYQVIASNLMPDINVVRFGEDMRLEEDFPEVLE